MIPYYYCEIEWKGSFNKVFTRKFAGLDKNNLEQEKEKFIKWIETKKFKLLDVKLIEGICTPTEK